MTSLAVISIIIELGKLCEKDTINCGSINDGIFHMCEINLPDRVVSSQSNPLRKRSVLSLLLSKLSLNHKALVRRLRWIEFSKGIWKIINTSNNDIGMIVREDKTCER